MAMARMMPSFLVMFWHLEIAKARVDAADAALEATPDLPDFAHEITEIPLCISSFSLPLGPPPVVAVCRSPPPSPVRCSPTHPPPPTVVACPPLRCRPSATPSHLHIAGDGSGCDLLCPETAAAAAAAARDGGCGCGLARRRRRLRPKATAATGGCDGGGCAWRLQRQRPLLLSPKRRLKIAVMKKICMSSTMELIERLEESVDVGTAPPLPPLPSDHEGDSPAAAAVTPRLLRQEGEGCPLHVDGGGSRPLSLEPAHCYRQVIPRHCLGGKSRERKERSSGLLTLDTFLGDLQVPVEGEERWHHPALALAISTSVSLPCARPGHGSSELIRAETLGLDYI
uniref:Uncharacterized protein n=1 Tax=Oryza punctata TaxID=4537 RepID=A0A0E0MMR6_ORYPU